MLIVPTPLVMLLASTEPNQDKVSDAADLHLECEWSLPDRYPVNRGGNDRIRRSRSRCQGARVDRQGLRRANACSPGNSRFTLSPTESCARPAAESAVGRIVGEANEPVTRVGTSSANGLVVFASLAIVVSICWR